MVWRNSNLERRKRPCVYPLLALIEPAGAGTQEERCAIAPEEMPPEASPSSPGAGPDFYLAATTSALGVAARVGTSRPRKGGDTHAFHRPSDGRHSGDHSDRR